MNNEWKPLTYQCKDCGDFIASRWSGDWQRCSCPDYIYIDQTEYYTRMGGRPEKFILVTEV